jgi:tRNA-dihydrouridine synthase B
MIVSREPLRIGSVELPGRVIAAPMAGISDLPFRELARGHGADLVCTEMVSAEALVRGTSGPTRRIMRYDEGERPVSMQLFGGRPDTMAEAARILCDHGVDLIDINMGCPVKKIIKSGAGAALMREPERAAALVAAVVKASHRPVTVKMRAGWDAASVNAPEVARACAEAGAAAVCVHARTRADGFGEVRDYGLLRRVKAAVEVPVIGNGGVDSPAVAERLLADYGCDAVMVGRGALGNPWLFAAIRARLRREAYHAPTVATLRDTLLSHLERAVAVHGEGLAVRRLRKHLAWYLRGLHGAHRAKDEMQRLEGARKLEEAIRRFFDTVGDIPSPAAV